MSRYARLVRNLDSADRITVHKELASAYYNGRETDAGKSAIRLYRAEVKFSWRSFPSGDVAHVRNVEGTIQVHNVLKVNRTIFVP